MQPNLSKGCANRRQHKNSKDKNCNSKSIYFFVEMQPNLSKGSAKIRLSETNGNLFTFVSVRILYKSKTIQELHR